MPTPPVTPTSPALIPDLIDYLLAFCARWRLAPAARHADSESTSTNELPDNNATDQLRALLTVAPDTPLVKHLVIPRIPSLSINALSRQGIPHGLDWWRTALVRFDRHAMSQRVLQAARPSMMAWYSEVAMDAASANGRVHILDWWWRSRLELKYSALAMHLAIVGGHAHVVWWWKEHTCDRMPLKLEFAWLLFHAVEHDRMDLLVAWADTYGLPVKEDLETNTLLAQRATEMGCVECLRWIKSKVSEMAYEQNMVIKYAVESGGLGVTRWWCQESGLPANMDFHLVLDMASKRDQVELLDYLVAQLAIRSNGRPDQPNWLGHFYSEEAMDSATYRGSVTILDWWMRSGLLLKYSRELVISETLAWSDRIEPESKLWATLDWWLRSGLHVDVDVSTIGWWKEPGKRWWAARKDERFKVGGGWVTAEETLEGLAEQAP